MKYIIPCYRKALTIKHCNCRFTCRLQTPLNNSPQVRVGDKCSIVIVDMKEFAYKYRNQYRIVSLSSLLTRTDSKAPKTCCTNGVLWF